MKVLYATMQFGRGYGQGTERYVSLLAGGLREHGHETIVLAGDPEHRGPDLPLGAPVEGETGVLHYPSGGWMSVIGLSPERLQPVLARERPHLVHVANPAHIGVGLPIAARAMGIPVVITIMDYWWVCPKHTLQHYEKDLCDADVTWRECVQCLGAGHPRRMVRALSKPPLLRRAILSALLFTHAVARGLPICEVRRWKHRQSLLADILNTARAVIFPSDAASRIIGPRLDHRRVHIIPYGLEPHWFQPRRPASHATEPIPPEKLTIGYAGALAEHKGVHLLLEAIRRLGWKTTRIRLAGGGEARYVRRLHRLAGGLNVEFLGRIPSSQMPAFFGGLDVLVVPSLWPENLPIVVLEAQATGLPVLASRVSGIEQAIPTPSHLFDVNSPDSLAECLAAWLAAPTPPPQANLITASEMVARTLRVYEQCL